MEAWSTVATSPAHSHPIVLEEVVYIGCCGLLSGSGVSGEIQCSVWHVVGLYKNRDGLT